MQFRLSLGTTIALTLAVLLGVGLLLALMNQQKTEPPMPNPNGWDDFMAAAQKLPKSDLLGESLIERKNFVVASQDALMLLRNGLQKETRVPTADLATNSPQRRRNSKTVLAMPLTSIWS